MKQLPKLYDLVKITETSKLALVRHVIPEQKKAKLVRLDGLGNFVSLGYHDIAAIKKVNSLLVE